MNFDQETLSRPIGGASNPSPGNSCQRPPDLIGCVCTCLARQDKRAAIDVWFKSLFIGGLSTTVDHFSAFVICSHFFLFCLQLFTNLSNYLPRGKCSPLIPLSALVQNLKWEPADFAPKESKGKNNMVNRLGMTIYSAEPDSCYHCQQQRLLYVCGQLLLLLWRATVCH